MRKNVNQLQNEMRLTADVLSKLGGVIYKKGTLLNKVDREILHAFGVEWVQVEEIVRLENDRKGNEKKITVRNMEKEEDFTIIFNKALKTVDQIINLAQTNIQIPLIDLRRAIYPLLEEKYQGIKYISELKYKNNDFVRYDSHHALSVGIISHAIARWHGEISFGESMQIALAGVLHDIGMTRIPNQIINSNGPITREEFSEIKKHTIYGYQILKGTTGLKDEVLISILQHHERIDGSGYPLRLKGDKIHLYAKIIALADVFHALISKRSYRAAYSPFQAMEDILTYHQGKLDSKLIEIFVTTLTNLPMGTTVLLNNGEKGTIIYHDNKNPTRPWVKTKDGVKNLMKNKEVFIKEIL